MLIVNTHEAKTKLSQLLAAVEQQHEVIRICRHGKPIADLVPTASNVDPLQMHPEISEVNILYDPTESLEDDEWPLD